MTVIFKRLIFPARRRRKIVHRLFDVVINRVIPRVCRLAGLEVGVRVSRGPADHRVLRIQRAGAMGIDIRLWQQIQKGVVCQRNDFIDLVRGAETIKEMNKRYATLKGCNVRNQREVLCFLYAAGAEHGATGLAHGHHVGMIAKNGEGVRGYGTGSNVQNKGR